MPINLAVSQVFKIGEQAMSFQVGGKYYAEAPESGPDWGTVREFAGDARDRIRLGKGVYRRDHLRAFAQHVEVADDEIRIMGTKSNLLRTLVAAKGGKSAGIGVPTFVPKWRAKGNR